MLAALRYLCQFSSMAAVMLSINAALGALLGFSFLYVEPGTGTYVVALLSLAILVTSSAVFLTIIVVCRRTKTRPAALAESSQGWEDEEE